MKNLVITLIAIVAMIMNSAFAQISATLQTEEGAMQFIGEDAFSAAVNAAQAGDFIYLSGGVFTAPALITKGVSIFGAGHYPDSTGATGATIVRGSEIFINCTADNFYLEGIYFINSYIYLGSNPDSTDYRHENVTFVRCRFNCIIKNQHGQVSYYNNGNYQSGSATYNFTMIGCVGNHRIDLSSISATIYNSILVCEVYRAVGDVFYNNIFIEPGWGSSNNNTITNNVIFAANQSALPSQSYVNNNLIYNRGNSGSIANNYVITNANAMFVDSTVANVQRLFEYTKDYHLLNPELYLGNDGTQVGIYGGTHVYKTSAVPSNPHIQSSSIAPQTNGEGLLPVNIRVKAQGGVE